MSSNENFQRRGGEKRPTRAQQEEAELAAKGEGGLLSRRVFLRDVVAAGAVAAGASLIPHKTEAGIELRDDRKRGNNKIEIRVEQIDPEEQKRLEELRRRLEEQRPKGGKPWGRGSETQGKSEK